MTDLRCSLDVERRLYNASGGRFDLFTVVERSPFFATYPKTLDGLIRFFRTDLPHSSVQLHDDNRTILLQHGAVWASVEQVDFLRMLFYPLYHCSWDGTAVELRDCIVRGELAPMAVKLVKDLLTPKAVVGVRLEDVPEDWRDLVVDYIKKGVVDLSRYSTISALEHRVDQLEGLLESDDLEHFQQPEDPQLPEEEREVLAKTLRLDPADFKTKRQAMELYTDANR